VLAVKRLKNSNSTDVFEMSSHILKNIIDIIHIPLCDLINISMASGIFPSILKDSIVVPIYKSGNSEDPSNFRPITLVPSISKVIEYLLLDQLRLYFNNFLNDAQFGFRPGIGVMDALDRMLNVIHENLELHKITSAYFLDLSKAFDSLSHSILLLKLRSYGVCDRELEFIRTYLVDRKQIVKVNGSYSKQLTTNIGVPQGSVLGPFLFIVYMNDFPYCIQASSVLYADDTTILMGHTNLNKLKHLMANEMDMASVWFKNNKLVLNEKKSTNILFSLSKEVINSSESNTVKLLGIHLDCDMSWNTHIDNLLKTLAKNLYLLRKLRQNLSFDCLKLSYFAFFHSHLTYGALFWGGSHRVSEIFILQKRAVRIIFGLGYRDSCRGYFKRLNMLTIHGIYIFHSILYIKSHLHWLKSASSIHCYNTRNRNLIVKPKTRLSKIDRSYLNQGITFFNLLPEDLKQLSYDTFRIKVKHLLTQIEGYSLAEIKNALS
jgi:hypothetical protein